MLTTECNLKCKYCFEEALEDFEHDFEIEDIDYSLPKTVNFDYQILKRFCSRDPECVLTFYGGEPLLRLSDIKKVMDLIDAKLFMVQTNGLFLDKLNADYVNRFHTILVSIDGEESLTNHYRGKSTHRKVIDNLKLIRKNSFQGELIARMTVMEKTDIYKQIRWLLENNDFKFSSVHWQLNAGFWGTDFQRRDFESWSNNNYIPGVKKLVKYWIDHMDSNNEVLRIYPFLGIANSLLFAEEKSNLRCGGGWINYTIQTDGNIIPCPTFWGMRKYYLGNIKYSNPLKLIKIHLELPPCTDCEIFGLCGGRCLYANITKRWNKQAYKQVCKNTKELIESVKKEAPRIKEIIDLNKISLSDFEFIKYNGCEIIP
jgi:putative peptide-modifying radical SAM enzyme